MQKCQAVANFIKEVYSSLAHLFVVKKMSLRFAPLHFLSLQKMCLRLLSLSSFLVVSDSSSKKYASHLSTPALRKRKVSRGLRSTSIFQLCCAPQELAYFFIKQNGFYDIFYCDIFMVFFIFSLTFCDTCGIIIVGNGMELQASLKNSELRVLGAQRR